jgi:hypothetical protein
VICSSDLDGLDFERMCADGFAWILKTSKHCAAEYFAHKELQEHRWRTHSQSEAVVFILPVYLGSSHRGACGGGKITHFARMDALASAIRALPAFKKSLGHDHMIIAPDFMVIGPHIGPELSATVQNFTFGHFESNRGNRAEIPWRCTVVVPYDDARGKSGEPAATPEADLEKRRAALHASSNEYTFADFLKREANFAFSGQVDSRAGYSARAAFVRAPATINNRNNVAGGYIGPRSRYQTRMPTFSCSHMHPTAGCTKHWTGAMWGNTLRSSLFSLMFRGDSATSGRLYDAVFQDTLSVVISNDLPRFGLPFQCLVPWDNILLSVEEQCFMDDPNAVLSSVGDMPLIDIEYYWEAMRTFRRDILWNVPGSRVVDNILLTAMQTCIDSSMHKARVMPCVFPSAHDTSP